MSGTTLKSLLLVFCGMLVLLQVFSSHADGEQESVHEVKIAVISNHGYAQSITRWKPTAAYLTREIPDFSFSIIPLDPAQFESAVNDHAVDFIISCPSLYIKLEVLYAATRIATMKTLYAQGPTHVFAAVLLCRSDRDDLRDFQDLRGQRLLGLHGQDCTTWHIACSELLQHGLNVNEDFAEVRFSADCEGVIQAVHSGGTDVGVLRSDMYDRMKTHGQIRPDQFYVFHEDSDSHSDVFFDHSTPTYPERVFATLRGTADELTERVTVALLKMPPRDIAAEAARCNGWTVPHNYQRFHNVLQQLKISPYEHFGDVTLATILVDYGPWIISILLLVMMIVATLGLTLLQTRRLNRARNIILEQQVLETSDRTQRTLGEAIHGTLGQQLTAIRLLAETLKDKNNGQDESLTRSVHAILELARKAVHDSRQIASTLYPAVLSHQGLGAAVESHLAAMNATFNIQYSTHFTEDLSSAQPEVSLHLYRIIQEAVHNAIKHGRANHIRVAIEAQPGSYILSIEDDGIGFNPDNGHRDGLGLHIMKYRAQAIGGDLMIDRGNPHGTHVRCTFKL